MKSRNPNNPTCSRTLEGFREFLNVHKSASPEEDKLLADALKILSRKSSENELKKADVKTDAKKYNSQSLDHSKLSREIYNNAIFKELSANASKILLLMTSSISQDNLIAFTNVTLSEMTNMSRPTANRALQELIDKNVIHCISKAKAHKIQESSIYELSDEWATVGKRAIKKLKSEDKSDFNLVECKRIDEIVDDYDDKSIYVTSRYYEFRLT